MLRKADGFSQSAQGVSENGKSTPGGDSKEQGAVADVFDMCNSALFFRDAGICNSAFFALCSHSLDGNTVQRDNFPDDDFGTFPHAVL